MADAIVFPPEAQGPFESAFHVLAIGHGRLSARNPQEADNRRRGPDGRPAAVFQIGLAGAGWYRDRRGRQELPGRGAGLCTRLPSANSYGNDSQDWERVWLTLGGNVAIECCQALINQAGHCFRIKDENIIADLLDLHELGGNLPSHAINSRAFRLLAACAAQLATGDHAHPATIVAALALLRQRIADPSLRLDDLAAAANLSRHHFARLFCESVGEPPLQHLIRRRLRRAAGMLRHGQQPVKQIAAACGYASRQRFSAAFSQAYGCSPQAWRRGV